jgi:general secretion pathway protein D
MKKSRLKLSGVWTGLLLSTASIAASPASTVQFKPGTMGLLSFIEMVSEKLDLQVDASRVSEMGRVSVSIPDLGPVSVDRAKAMVLTSLHLQGLTWIHVPSIDLYRITRERDARDEDIPLLQGNDSLPENDLMVTYIMDLHHVPSDYVARAMRSFMPANGRIIPVEETRAVIITDTAYNISKLKALVSKLDTEEVAKDAKKALLAGAKRLEQFCPSSASEFQGPQTWLWMVMFSLIALIFGFLARGYLIRRIEGGL